jgi:hypothetical protein
MKSGSGIVTPYKDCAVEYPNPGHAEQNEFGGPEETLRGDPGPTKGIMKEVQFSNIHGAPKTGEVHFVKVPGGGGENE